MNDINLGNMQIPVIKPQKGVDYYTETEKQELIQETTAKVNQIIDPKETERQANEQIRKLNEEDRKAQESTRISNETGRKSNEGTRQNNEDERQTNEQSRIEAEQSRNTTFNNQLTENEKAIQNIKDKTTEYNANAETKTNEFNSNAGQKTQTFNENVEQKTQTFNENANAKLQEINQIKDITEAKIAEINEKDEAQDTEISNIKSKNTELKAENERLREDLNNTVPSVSGEGENVILNNTSNARFKKFGISGNSCQETGDVTDEEGNVIGTMPSPEFRSEIKNVTGNANFHVVPELADISKFTTNGYVNGLGTISSPSGKGEKSTEPVKVKPNTNYTFFIINTNSKFDNWIGIGEYEEESSSSFIKRNTSTASFKYNFTTSEKTNYVILSARNLEEATNVSFYETSKIQSFTFPLAEGQRLMKGDYLADDGIHHKRKQYVFTGNETGWNYNSKQNVFSITNSNIPNALNLAHEKLCNYFQYSSSFYNVAEINTLCENNNSIVPMFIFKVDTSLASNSTEWKTFLSERYVNGTPVVVEYELAEEVIEPYTEEQQAVYDEIKKTAHSYRDTTHIFSTDEISPIFNVEALADIQAMFNNLQVQILAGEV